MKRIAFATCGQLPFIKADEQPTAALLGQQGISVESIVWDKVK